MTKFAKKITKGSKVHENCVVVGNIWNNLDEITEVFNTVFILTLDSQEFKKRNVVYREDFDDLSILPVIDTVFVDYEKLEHLVKLEKIINKYRLTVYIGHPYHVDNYYRKFLYGRGYELVEFCKTYQIWKPKK